MYYNINNCQRLSGYLCKTAFMGILIFVLVIAGSLSGEIDAGPVLEDMAGRKVEVPAKVDRVVTTYTPATQFIMALGAEKRLVAGSVGLPNQKLFEKIYPNINQLPQVGSKNKGVNLETILKVDPDLVIMYPHGDGLNTADRLEELGIPTLVIKPESFEQIRETNMLLGKALSLPEKAEKIDKQYRRIFELAERSDSLNDEDRKKVYFANSEILDTVGGGLLQTDLIEMAGGINPARPLKQGFIRTSSEELIKWDPEVIIVSQFFSGSLDKLRNSPKYQSIEAFKSGDIYRIPSNLEPWDYPSPSSSLIVPWLGKILYPELYEDVNISKIVNNFYEKVYGRSYFEFDGEL